MHYKKDRYQEELDQLLEQVDALFPELREEQNPQPNAMDFDPDDYTPEDARIDEPLLYQNFSNNYGNAVWNSVDDADEDFLKIPV